MKTFPLILLVCFHQLWPMEQKSKKAYLQNIPIQVLNYVVLPFLQAEPLPAMSAQKKTIEQIIDYYDTQKERTLLSSGILLQNTLSIHAQYTMPSPSKKNVAYLCKYAQKSIIVKTSITIIDILKKEKLLQKDSCKELKAIAVNDAGSFYALCQKACICCGITPQKNSATYYIVLCDIHTGTEIVLHTISIKADQHIKYKTVITFSKNNSSIMVQLPNGKIYILKLPTATMISQEMYDEQKISTDINDFFCKQNICKQFITKKEEE